MRFQTVRDILDFVRGFHQRAAQLFSAAADEAQRDKARWMLEWLAQHERRFSEALATFEQSPANAPLLQEWLQYAPDLERLPLQLPRLPAQLSADDAAALALAFDDYLVRLYKAVLDTCESREICDLFRMLLDQERAEERSVARSLSQLQDF
ncbi:hypothetical protein AAG565_05340 [Fontimonas sp. SYSU GA230001]|uniref:hypothetical protein n=1 Tax=Fontimonas sp. SYSU GA230001 TaxID=3142450 RepID=UPI0032B58977